MPARWSPASGVPTFARMVESRSRARADPGAHLRRSRVVEHRADDDGRRGVGPAVELQVVAFAGQHDRLLALLKLMPLVRDRGEALRAGGG